MSNPASPTPISVIRNYTANGAPIACIRGKFTKLYDGNAGENSHGPYRIQNGVFQDDAGDTIDVQIKDMDDDWGKTYLNTPLEIYAYQGDKKLTGLYAFDDEYRGKSKRKIKITKTAEVTWLQGGGGSDRRDDYRRDDPPPRQQQHHQQQRRQDHYEDDRRGDRARPAHGYDDDRRDPPPRQQQHSEPRRQDPPPRQQPAERPPEKPPFKEAMEDIMKMTVLYAKCYDAAASVAWRNYDQHKQINTSIGIATLASTFFIESCKKGLHAKMPVLRLDEMPEVKGRKVGDLMSLLTDEIAARKMTGVPAPLEPGEAKPPENFPGRSLPPAFSNGTNNPLDDDEIPF